MKKVVKGFASVILASMIFVVGCKPPTSTSEPPGGGSDPKITVTVAHDDNVENVEPATLSVAKGSTWSTVKSQITVTYKDGYGEAGWKKTNASGEDLKDNDTLEKDTTIFACSGKLLTITVKGDEHVDKIITTTLSVAKGSKWSAVKPRINVTYKNGYGEAGWKLDNADGDDLTDDKKFEEDTTVFAVSQEAVTITVAHDANIEKVEPTTLSVAKGSSWSAIKSKITVTYKNGFAEAGWKLDNASGADLADDYPFNSDTTVFAVSKEVITITVQGDAGIEIPTENTFTVDNDTKWGDIKTAAKAKIRMKENYALFEWRLNDEIGDVITTDDLIFTGSATVFAVSKEAVKITVAHDAGVEKVEPATLSVAKESTWSAIKSQIRVTTKPDFVHAGWKLDNASGADLTDDYSFEQNATVFAVSKKQQVTITVKGDVGIDIAAENTFTADKNAKWGDIKTAAKAKITVKANYDFVEWLNSGTGEVLTDDKTFEQNTTIFAVSKKQQVTITVKGDAGIDIAAENTFTVDKNKKWGEIKDLAKDKITVKENYEFVEWRLDSGTGEVLTDDKAFEQNTTVFAVSKEKAKEQVTLTVKGDERIDLSSPLQIEYPYNTKWSDIQADIKEKIKPSADWKDDWNNGDYAVYEWRLGDESGEKIWDSDKFTDNTTVYAVSNYTKWKIADDGSDNKVLSGVEGREPRGKIIIPDGVTSIGEKAFEDCSGLTSITIPKDVKSIEWEAFFGCSGLLSITIPEGVKWIEGSAFSGCSSLASITLPKGLLEIGIGAFSGCSGLTSITIPEGVKSIEMETFADCRGLTSITLSKDLTEIGMRAFSGCSGLVSITIPEGVKSIGYGAFQRCSSLASITLSKDLTSIEDYAFDGCSGLTSITIPEGVKSIEKEAFSGCSGLTSITLSKNLNDIKEKAFYDCSGLTSITIPASVKSIREKAFYGCSRLDYAKFEAPDGWKDYSNTPVDVSRYWSGAIDALKEGCIYKNN